MTDRKKVRRGPPSQKARSRRRAEDSGAQPEAGRSLVVVGASAGGVTALQRLLRAVPKAFAAPILVVIHRDQEHESAIEAILGRATPLPVKEAKNGEPLRGGVVYVAKMGHHLEVAGHRIRLSRAPPIHFSRPSIDRLFETAAKAYGEGVVALVLSGTGRDGSEGVRAVKAAGGTTAAESPRSAAYPGMPESAIGSGAVDVVLPIDELGPFVVRAVLAGVEPRPLPASGWNQLLAMLQHRFGVDFSGYKATTLQRRFTKRLLATGKGTLEAYVRYVRDHPNELDELQAAFLIKVSDFFRDKAAWRELDKQVVRRIAREAGPGRDVRVWSAGCATGEEPYSAAMLFLEALPARARERLKIFATDIDEDALAIAREGAYTAAQVEGVPPPLLKKYFAKEGNRFRLRKDVRRRIIFGRHDVTKDPPITGLDLLICRNLLIYLNTQEKQEVLGRFGYAVKPDCALFLGKSEGVQSLSETFRTLSTPAHLFRREAIHRLPAPKPTRGERVQGPPTGDRLTAEVQAGRREISVQQAFQHMLLNAASITLVGIDGDRRVTLWNHAAASFFGAKSEQALGRSVFEVLDGLSADLLGKALRTVRRDMQTVIVRDVAYEADDDSKRWLDIELSPLAGREFAEGSVLLFATDATTRHGSEERQKELVAELRKSAQEAARASDELAESNEELETLNEELQSTAEEHQTLNEELQSRNEELETVNEELQSANQELTTLNEEVVVRTEEGARTAHMLRALLDLGSDIVIVCDDENKVLVWSPMARHLFHVSEQQVLGRDLFTLVPSLDVPPIRGAVRQVIRQRPSIVKADEVKLGDGVHVSFTVTSGADRLQSSYGYIVRLTPLEAKARAAAPRAGGTDGTNGTKTPAARRRVAAGGGKASSASRGASGAARPGEPKVPPGASGSRGFRVAAKGHAPRSR